MVERFPTEAELSKRRVIQDLLQSGMITIQLDPRRAGVSVPAEYASQAALTLNLSHAFRLDVFEFGAFSIKANLSFSGDRHLCVLPYESIYAVVSQAEGKHLLFPEDVPVELMGDFLIEDQSTEELTGPESDPERGQGVEDSDSTAQGKRSHLRLIK
ncbi:MAG: ClpXP protease specificity-enhancing factor SspB [Bradymonadia bacterium]